MNSFTGMNVRSICSAQSGEKAIPKLLFRPRFIFKYKSNWNYMVFRTCSTHTHTHSLIVLVKYLCKRSCIWFQEQTLTCW